MLARGNTETETINLNIDVENTVDRWTHKAGASLLRTSNDDVTSADRWELRGESRYSLDTTQLPVRRAALRGRSLHGLRLPGDRKPAATATTSS